MKKKLIVSVCFILALTNINSQSNFQKGYVLTSAKDTIFGLIRNNDYYSNSRFCIFEKDANSPEKKYLPGEIYGYRFADGKFYLSKIVGFNENKDTLFLEYLIHGKLDVFYYRDKYFVDHYFATKDTLPLYELNYSKKIVLSAGREVERESKGYIGPLSYLTSDCPAIRDQIPAINEPNTGKLIKFAKKYHNLTCSNESCIIYKKKIPRKIGMSIYGGMNYFLRNEIYTENGWVPVTGFNLFFQQASLNENVFLGLGLRILPKMYFLNRALYQIPISFNYIHQSNGLNPIASYELDLDGIFLVQAIRLGLNYRMNGVSFSIESDLKTLIFIFPYATSFTAGLYFDLN